MNIRTATLEDISLIINLWDETQLTRPWNNPKDDITRALLTPTSTLLIAEIDNQLMGTVMTGYDGHRGWIYYLAIDPHFQRQGFGKQLVEAAELWLKFQGAPKVLLMVRKSNEEVLNFYTSIGYEDGEVIVLGKWVG